MKDNNDMAMENKSLTQKEMDMFGIGSFIVMADAMELAFSMKYNVPETTSLIEKCYNNILDNIQASKMDFTQIVGKGNMFAEDLINMFNYVADNDKYDLQVMRDLVIKAGEKVKDYDFANMEREELEGLGFVYYNKENPIMLIPIWIRTILPSDLKLRSINNDVFTAGTAQNVSQRNSLLDCGIPLGDPLFSKGDLVWFNRSCKDKEFEKWATSRFMRTENPDVIEVEEVYDDKVKIVEYPELVDKNYLFVSKPADFEKNNKLVINESEDKQRGGQI